MSDSGGANSAGVGALPSDPNQPLTNLSAVSSRMDSLQRFLSDSISRNVLLDPLQMDMVSSEISSAIHQAILSASSLLSLSRLPPNPTIPQSKPLQSQSKPPQSQSQPKPPQSKPVEDEIIDHGDYEVIELDSVELLAEHVHFCDICGKGFKRDANLRMHMRAHGDQYKRPEALSKPPPAPSPETSLSNLKETRFSCPFAGCNRNQHHRKFRALKSVICVRNHFKRSHCPKMYSCNRCNKKSFSVLADLKSHLKNCGESKWRCSCGTTFSRKDKLFGHMALFEGHMPAIGGGGVVVVDDDDSRSKTPSTPAFMEEDEVVATSAPAPAPAPSRVVDDAFFDDGMFADQLPGIDDRYIQQMFGSSSSPDFVHQFYNM